MIPNVPVQSKFFALAGGLDTASPATMIAPGKCFDASNYEIDSVNGGYRRCKGYEIFDGHAPPSEANYWVLPYQGVGTISVGDTVTGGTSLATGKVLAIVGDDLILGRVTDDFVQGENLTVSAVLQGITTGTSTMGGAETMLFDATYYALAADDLRADISAVPGSGPIRGVFLYGDTVYAFRNNALGTACVMHKSTAAGWVAVTMFYEVTYTTGAVAKPAEGAILTQGGVTATVLRVLTRTGAWTGTAAGTLMVSAPSGGNFAAGAATAGASTLTLGGVQTQVTLAPGGTYEFTEWSFTGATGTTRIYGCDGANKAFEFDGTVYVPIRTGMTTDTPNHIAAHKNYLWLAFGGSLQNSGIADPYSWTVITGANEIAMGDTITALLPQPGDATATALHVFSKKMTKTLYGSTSGTWNLVTASPTTGAEVGSVQWIGTALSMTQRGLQQITTTVNFGDFQFSAISGLVQSLINTKLGTVVASAAYKERNQYRVIFTDGTWLALTLAGVKSMGIMPGIYTDAPTCYHVGSKSDGREYCFFGDATGKVYQDNVGTSHDGDAWEWWLRMPFNHVGAPQYRKRFRRAVFDTVIDSYTTMQISYEMDSGSGYIEASYITDRELLGSGGFWDQFTWDQFVWDAPIVNQPVIAMDGTSRNMSLLIYGNSAIEGSHAVQGVTLNYTIRRLER